MILLMMIDNIDKNNIDNNANKLPLTLSIVIPVLDPSFSSIANFSNDLRNVTFSHLILIYSPCRIQNNKDNILFTF